MDSFQSCLWGSLTLVKMALTNGYSLTEGNGIEMLLEINHLLLTGFRAKLNSSSLPLEARCRLATNAITCRVAVPHRLSVIKQQNIRECKEKFFSPSDKESSQTPCKSTDWNFLGPKGLDLHWICPPLSWLEWISYNYSYEKLAFQS